MRRIVQTATLVLALLMAGCGGSEDDQASSGYPLTPTTISPAPGTSLATTAQPTATPTVTPTPAAAPTATPTRMPLPTATSTPAAAPTATPTRMPLPTATPTPTPVPPATPTPTRVAPRNPAEMPPFPNIYSGTVTISGLPAKDGIAIYGRMGNYRTPDVFTKDGRYLTLVIGPPSPSYIGAPITFVANIDGVEIAASIPSVFREANLMPPFLNLQNSLDLFFQ